MAKQLFMILSSVIIVYSSFGQAGSNYIFFYKPYTDSLETNLYKDTSIRFDYKTQYANIKNARVKKDVEWAIKNNDFRIISISGYTYLFPGLEGGYTKLKDGTKAFVHLDKKYEEDFKRFGFKVIKGTSDVIGEDDLPLQTVSYNYAKSYNRLLMAVISKKKKSV